METIEIRQNKKTLIPIICLFTAALFGMTYYIYFSGKFDDNSTMKIIYIFLTASLLYTIIIPIRKFIKDEPVLTLSKNSLLVNEKLKSITFTWQEITNWQIEKIENTHYLNIQTTDKLKKINISWLEKKPDEIEALIEKYTLV
jgi:hypothetical protein